MIRAILAVVAVFVVWTGVDFVIHGVVLAETYAATAELWRPMDEMKMYLIHLAVLVSAIVFVAIYAGFFANKGMKTAVGYGVLFGFASGFSMGYGTYAVMPIPYKIALVWFWGWMIEAALGGILLGLIVGKSEPAAVPQSGAQ